MSRARAVFLPLLILSTLCLPRPAAAQACPVGKDVLVVLLSMDMPYDASSTTILLAQLQTGLSSLGLVVCTDLSFSQASPVARIRLSQSNDTPSSLHIEVRDTLTEKLVSRELDLTELPPDSRPFALALACDELLRASWLELAVRTPPAPTAPASKALIAELQQPLVAERAPRKSAIGVALALDAYVRGELHTGGDIVATHWVLRALGIEVSAGLREGTAIDGTHGSARASLVGGALAVRYRPVEMKRFALSLGLRTQVWRATMRGRAQADATDNEGNAWAVTEQATILSTWYAHVRCALSAELGVGFALRQAVATDEQQKVAGVFGMQLVSGLRVATPF